MEKLTESVSTRGTRFSSEQAAHEAPGGAARRPFRLWMTGSFAVVMAALVPARSMSVPEFERGKQVVRHSRFGVEETVARLREAASGRGLSVLALVPGERPVLVLASSAGGTLAIMDSPESRPEMPLSMWVRQAASGGADVVVRAECSDGFARDWRDWQELPAGVADEVDALPGLVERALA